MVRVQLVLKYALSLLFLFTLSIAHAQDAMPSWSQLTEDQQKVLSPLAAEWDSLRPWQREKMLDIARDYPKMDPEKQERVKNRLTNWSRMTPYERENARKRHQRFKDLPEEKKTRA